MALRWIKENIAGFNGDRNRVTVRGISAGAQSIALHLHSFEGKMISCFVVLLWNQVGQSVQLFKQYPIIPSLSKTW